MRGAITHRAPLYAEFYILNKRKEGKDMNMATVIAVIAIVLIVFFAVRYIYKEKKKGTKCIGCPYADSCQKHQSGNSC